MALTDAITILQHHRGNMETQYFKSCSTKEQLRARYKELCKQYHPDLNPDVDITIIQQINSEIDYLINVMPNINGKTWTEDLGAFQDIMPHLIRLHDVEIEICGSWIWVTGDTKAKREYLKAHGLKYSGQKKAWYWTERPYHKKSKKSFTLQAIREMYGSRTVKSEQLEEAIA